MTFKTYRAAAEWRNNSLSFLRRKWYGLIFPVKRKNLGLAGDTIYLYVAAPVSAILFRCKAIAVDIPYQYENEHLKIEKLVRRYLRTAIA